MNGLQLPSMVAWLEGIGLLAKEHNVELAQLQQHEELLPSAFADFDTEDRSGRISIWATGLIDLEVYRGADGEQLHFEHAEVETLTSPGLAAAVRRFLDAMKG